MFIPLIKPLSADGELANAFEVLAAVMLSKAPKLMAANKSETPKNKTRNT
jgi:hypothetical protein